MRGAYTYMGTIVCVMFLILELKHSLQLFSVLPVVAGLSLAAALSLGLGDHVWRWDRALDYFKSSLLGVILGLCVMLALLVYGMCYRAGALRGCVTVALGSVGARLEAGLLSLSFALLIGLLFPCVVVMADTDFGVHRAKYLAYMLWIYAVSCLLMFSADVCLFYIVYEFLIGLVFLVMYATANSRGGVEAILFFAGWAVVGSFLVGVAVIYIVCCCQACTFQAVAAFHFSADELYYLYVLFFFGFGTKLSTWPLWYWLPRAHVEVSTGMSIFLSCILIKICLYALVRFLTLLQGDLVIIPFIFVVCLSVFDLTLRLSIQTDLKAITAYGSVLHVNLLLLLVLLDTSVLSAGTLLYVWGHSYATAGAFFAINLAERATGSRSTFENSGLYMANPMTAMVCIAAMVTFLEFPLCFFFWGEFWLWVVVLDSLPLSGLVLMFIGAIVYVMIYFRLWWGVIFGGMGFLSSVPRLALSFEEGALGAYILLFQFIVGLQPNLLSFYAVN